MKPFEITKIFLLTIILASFTVFISITFAQTTNTTTTQTTTTTTTAGTSTTTATIPTTTTTTTTQTTNTTQATTTTATIPTTTTTTSQQTCTKDQLGYCKTQSECQTAGGYWSTYYNSCSSQPQDKSTCTSAGRYWCGTDASGYCQSSACPQCSKVYPGNCYTQGDCTGAGLYWCGNHCQTSSCPACSTSQKYNCFSETDCKSAGGQWCATWPPGSGNNYCTDSCPSANTTTTTTIATCPTPPSPPTCPSGQNLKANYDAKGCLTGYTCFSSATTAFCGNRICESGETPTSCPIDCQIATACPEVPPPTTCPSGQQLSKATDGRGCVVGYNCISVATTATKPICPLIPVTKPSCPSDNIVPIITDAGCLVGYNCIPQGCRQEIDPKTQISRVVCEEGQKCPATTDLQGIANTCIAKGGRAAAFVDPSGCKFVDCRFTGEEVSPDPIIGHTKCPSDKETDGAVKACRTTGLFPTIAFEGGCKIVKCIQQKEERCRIPTPDERLQLENKCSANGLPILKDVDTKGCAFYRCGETKNETCVKEVPPEAFSKCQSIGGEMIVKKDQNACIAYVNCITRGDERDSYVEPGKEVPDATQLLQIALKLEQLKVELKKLSDQAENIAAYYAGKGDEDEERFNRVSSMFVSAANRIDEIKNTIRQKLNSLTKDDMLEIKRDIKQLKEVTIKDIVYMMLSNSNDVKETLKASKKISASAANVEDVEKSGSDCGTDGLCFDRAFRVCKPVAFKPEGRHGPVITVVGLDGDICVVKAKMPENLIPKGAIPGVNPPYEMTCRFKEYSFGVRGPEDFLPNCQGSMAELIKKYGTQGVGQGGRGFEGPGGCKGPEECSKFCNSNPQVCQQWCSDHPDICPQGKSGEFRGGSEKGFPQEEFGRQQSGFGQPSQPPEGFRQSAQPGFGGSQQVSKPSSTQACVGCLNNGVCDIGECSECVDCLKR